APRRAPVLGVAASKDESALREPSPRRPRRSWGTAPVLLTGLAIGLFVLMQLRRGVSEPDQDQRADEIVQVEGTAHHSAPVLDRSYGPDAHRLPALEAIQSAGEQLAPETALQQLSDLLVGSTNVHFQSAVRSEMARHEDRTGRELRARLDQLARAAGPALKARRYGEALSSYTSLLMEARALGDPQLEATVRQARVDIATAARADWDRLRAEALGLASEGRHAEAEARLREGLVAYRGTRLEALARSEMMAIAASRSATRNPSPSPSVPIASDPAPSSTQPVSASAADRETAMAAVTAAEAAGGRREWSVALADYDRALAAIGETAKDRHPDWVVRRELMAAFAGLKMRVRELTNAADRAPSMRIGRLSARPIAATDEAITLKMGRGPVTFNWADLAPSELLDVLSIAVDSPERQVGFALACRELGDEPRALENLAVAASSGGFKILADRLVAEWRGEAVPVGGYVIDGGEFLVPEAAENRRLAAQARVLAKTLERARDDKFRVLAHQLREMGEPAVEPLREALANRYSAAEAELRKHPVFRELERTRAFLEPELLSRRKAAFELIFDKQRYPYPYGPNQKEVQAEVDALVERVRQLVDQPSSWLLEQAEPLREQLATLHDIVSFFPPGGSAPVPEELLADLDRSLDMRHFGLSPSDRKVAEEVATFNRRIKSSITDDERGVHDITNAYRMLMGLRPVKIEETLVLAARSHSQEMKDLGYFAHESPDPKRRSPTMRAQIAGWGGSCSENIARGSSTPAMAVAGWIGSSGHHRNLLGAGWTHLGCGKAADGFFWTQNFAKGASTKLSLETKDDADSKPQ
ncbi:MAG: CAP domain-containing protein, partial [Planctomycetes bacterium]|nr:CAP domain-containing protein [Planctomycetota bacterium]